METKNNVKKDKEITFAELFDVLKVNIVLIVIAAIICAALGGAYSLFIDKPQYVAKVSFWVNTSTDSSDYTSSSLTTASSSLATSFTELVCQTVPLMEVVKTHNLTEELKCKSDEECVNKVLRMMRSYKEDTDSALFFVSITAGSKDTVFKVATALQDVMPTTLEILNDEKVNVTCASRVESVNSITTKKSSPIVMGALGGFVGAVLAYVAFFIKSMFDTVVYDEKSLTGSFDYPIIGYIPTIGDSEKRRKNKGFKSSKKGPLIVERNYDSKLINQSSPFLITEAFNSLRTNLVYSVASKNSIFAVTSDTAGAGKTLVSSNLAISFANLGKRVLLVECDMRCPAFYKVFGRKTESGLSELLAGISEKSDSEKIKIGVENLDVIFCGKIPPNPSELLSSARMKELADEWRSEYDCVIFDMPPLGDVFDAGVVSSIVDGYVIAARCNISDVDEVREAVGRVESVGGSVLGFVLNDINLKASKKYKHYYTHGNEA